MKANSAYCPPFLAWFVWLIAMLVFIFHEVFIPRAFTNTKIYWAYYGFNRNSVSEIEVAKWMANILTLTDDYYWSREEAHKVAFPHLKK